MKANIHILPAAKLDAMRIQARASPRRSGSMHLHMSSAWRALARRLFAWQAHMVGNPLYEAWTADGEPLERMTPTELAKSSMSRHLIVPHSRSR